MAGRVLASADDLNVTLPTADRAYLLADLAATIDRRRAWDAPLPEWVSALEIRFLGD
jgi:ABC-type cobalamin transport system ATPase subunit